MDHIALVPYDMRWPQIFAQESQAVRVALTPFGLESVEHVGSTAVPGMSAKPIVDILAGMGTLEPLPRAHDPFWTSFGYDWGHGQDRPEDWFYFIKRDASGERIAHLHVVPFNGEFWQRLIVFRDTLREDSSLARKYEALKIALAAEHRHDRLRYRDEKQAFVNSVVNRRMAGE